MRITFAASAFTLTLTLLVSPLASQASENEELAKKNNCLACHQVDKKLVGPSYQDVAAKYKDQANAQAMLAQKIKEGGAGVWGQIPMPPNPAVSDEDLNALAAWILEQAK